MAVFSFPGNRDCGSHLVASGFLFIGYPPFQFPLWVLHFLVLLFTQLLTIHGFYDIMCLTNFFAVRVFALVQCCFFVYWLLLLCWAYYNSIYLNCQVVNINFSKFVWLHKHDNLYFFRFHKKDVFPCFLKYGTSHPFFRISKNFFKNFCKTPWQMRSMGV